jgi:hypothetical protein
MKLWLYKENAEHLQQICLGVLEEMGYHPEQHDISKGWIHAYKEGVLPNQFFVLDLRIADARYATLVTVFSSVFSGTTGNFQYHPEAEIVFTDHFFWLLKGENRWQQASAFSERFFV